MTKVGFDMKIIIRDILDLKIVKTQLNSTQLISKKLKSNFVGLDIVLTCNPHHQPTHNFSVTSRPARELKFGTDTHYTNLIKITKSN